LVVFLTDAGFLAGAAFLIVALFGLAVDCTCFVSDSEEDVDLVEAG
jgi:hypothetical protein